MKNYPDISATLKKKAAQRRMLASLPFEKKIELVFKLKERQRFIKSGRAVINKQKAEHDK
ncbi:MAG: hypothetical protein M3447_07040 [Acidobacteriota bacterium]|nr:hypothetical protein [Acidobacteriota bacterium]